MFDCVDLPPESAGPPLREGIAQLCRAIRLDFRGRIAVVSSFGAESAVLLAHVADIDRTTPILFIDTKKHFEETHAYRDTLRRRLGLTDVRLVSADSTELAKHDPPGELWRFDPDACCRLRKVVPLERALAPFDAWITGRKRHQTATRATLPFIETVAGKTKINPLADWTREEVRTELARRSLPTHPLGDTYPSIGCAPCTRAVATGDDPRSGRWADTAKIECGIHGLGGDGI